MSRALGAVALGLLLTGCPSYDRYTPVVDQDGLVPPDVFARYGTEQAQAVAIGRALGASAAGTSPEARARQLTAATEYAQTLPGVSSVVADSQSYVLTVTFASGWRKAIVPIEDGVTPDRTTGLPSAR
jgi:hypothetical protein